MGFSLTRTVAKGALLDTDNRKYLMVRSTLAPWHWSFVGGGIHHNEDPERAFRREVKEETNLSLVSVVSSGTCSVQYQFFGFRFLTLIHCFVGTVQDTGRPQLNWENVAYGFLSRRELALLRGRVEDAIMKQLSLHL